jgi:hypothetical protein
MIPRRCIQCNRLFDSFTVGDDLCSTECENTHRAFIAQFQAMKKEAKWLSNPFEIQTASSESLIRSLLTSDGRGEDFKRRALFELLVRVKIDDLILPK